MNLDNPVEINCDQPGCKNYFTLGTPCGVTARVIEAVGRILGWTISKGGEEARCPTCMACINATAQRG